MAFFYAKTGRYAVLEAKYPEGLGSLAVDSKGIRQGSLKFNETRLKKYITNAPNPNLELANRLTAELNAGRLDSYASFYSDKKMYQLNFPKNANFRITPNAASLIER